MVFRKDLSVPLTSIQVDNNFQNLVKTDGTKKVAYRSIFLEEEHQQFDEVNVFALPIPDIPSSDYSFDVLTNWHMYSTVNRDNVPFVLNSDNFGVNVKSDGSVTTSAETFVMYFDTVDRILYFKTNAGVSGLKSIDWFVLVKSFNAVFLDNFDKTLSFY